MTIFDPPTLLIPPREDAPELLDRNLGHPDDVRTSLDDLWRINVLLGGVWSLTRHLYPRLKAASGPVTVIDIGAGAADIAAAVARWTAHQHIDATVIPVDISGRHFDHARRHAGLHLLQADALRLPLAPHSADFVVSSLFLHHFSPPQVIDLLRAAKRAARRGVIMSDLVRGHLPMAAWHVARPVLARSHITAHDGLVSIKRSYTPAEFLRMAEAAGMNGAHVAVQFPWRMALVWDTD